MTGKNWTLDTAAQKQHQLHQHQANVRAFSASFDLLKNVTMGSTYIIDITFTIRYTQKCFMNRWRLKLHNDPTCGGRKKWLVLKYFHSYSPDGPKNHQDEIKQNII